jgi:tetratricopeptide (TPR) repeat protein
VFEVGSRIANQYLVERVASGGMGLVLMVRDEFSGSLFAVKTIKDEALASAAVRERFGREARTWMNLGRHDNLVSAHFYRQVDDRPFLFLEYVDGEDLKTLLSRDAPVPLVQVLDWGLQLCRGMSQAHRTEIAAGHPGVVHRDLKPANLFVTRERVLKVSDFGMAKAYDHGLESTAEGIGMGTPHYMPPEQLRNARSVDARSDIYAAGMVLYELATGVLPLKAERIENQIYNILNVTPPPASSLNPRIGSEMDATLACCLEKDREYRFPSFLDLAERLTVVAAESGGFELDAGACCGSCGLPTSAGPGTCPLCGMSTRLCEDFRPLAVEVGLRLRSEEVEPAPRIVDVEVSPRVARTGSEVRLNVVLVNSGVIARDAVLTLPEIDGFRRVEDHHEWRGAIPACDAERATRVEFRLVPLREGSVELPPVQLSWRGPGGRRESLAGPVGVVLPVEVSSRFPLVGRERDLSVFENRLRDVLGGEAAAVVVTGEIGIGRTRFLDEMAAEAERQGFLVLRGKAVGRGVQPLKTLHDGLIAHCGLVGRRLSPESVLTAIVDRLAPHLGNDPDLVAYLADFIVGVPPTRDDTRERVYQRWARLYSALAGSQPVALVLDDLHWGEGETRDVLVNVLRRAREEGVPLVLVASWLESDPDAGTARRIGHLEEMVGELEHEGVPLDRLALGRLDLDEIERFVESMFPGNHFEADHPWFQQALAEVSAGRPYFLQEILRTIRSGGEGLPGARCVDGMWQLDPDMDEDSFRMYVPDAIDGMLQRHLSSLPDAVRSVAELAAMLGDEFDVAVLIEVVGNEDEVDHALEELERADVVRPVDTALRRYRFPHSLAPSVLAKALAERSPRGARRRHRAIVAAMRRLYSKGALRRHAVRLGRHLVSAGEGEEGFRTLVAGAGDLAARQAFPRAWSALTSAEAALEDEAFEIPWSDRVRFLALRGEVAGVTGRYVRGLECFREIVVHAGEGTDESQDMLAEAYSNMGWIHELRGEYDDAYYCYGLGKDLRIEEQDTAGLRNSLVNIGRVHMLRGEPMRARRSFEEAKEQGERAADAAVVAESSIHLGTLDLGAGRMRDARLSYRKALRLARGLKDRSLAAQGLNGLGNAAQGAGQMDRALVLHKRALALRRTIGDREGLSKSYNNIGVALANRGADREALSYYERSAVLHRDLGSRHGLAAVLGNVAHVRLRLGEVTKARETVEEAVSIRRELGDLSRLGTSCSTLGDVLAEMGDASGAQAAWEDARRLSEQAGQAAELAGVLVRLARAALERDDHDATAALIEEALAIPQGGPAPEVDFELALIQGDLALGGGRGEEALEAAERAEKAARLGLSLVEGAKARALEARAWLCRGDAVRGIDILVRVVADLESESAPAPALAAALLGLARAQAASGPVDASLLARARAIFEDLANCGRRDDELAEIRDMGGS